jgi:hypothetical protein
MNIPKTSAHFSTSLASKITSSSLTMTLVSATDKAGNALSGLYGFVLDKGSASEEFTLGTVSGTTVTFVVGAGRGLDPSDGKTEVTALKLPHRRGATVDITDYPLLAILLRLLNADESFPNKLKYATDLTFTDDKELVPKKYVDGVALAGAPDAATGTKGVTKLSTAPVSPTSPIAVGDNDNRVPTQGENDGLAATTTPSSSNLFITQKDFQKGAEISGSTTGSANAYVFTPSPALAAYAAGMTFRLKANFTNSGAATLNISGLGAVAIKKLDGATALVSGDIVSGQEFFVIHDGTNFQMLSPVGQSFVASYVSAQLSGTSSTTQNVDSVLTTGFAPKVITLYYLLNGVTAGSNKFSGGTAIYNSVGTLILNQSYFIDSAASTGTFSFNVSTTAPVSGTAAGTFITVTLSIINVTSTGFTVRAAYSQSGGPTGAVTSLIAVATA